MFDIKNQYSVVLIVSLSVIFAVEIYKKPKITHFAVFSFSCSCVNPHLHTRVACLNCHVLYFCTMCSFYRKTAGCFFCLAFFCWSVASFLTLGLSSYILFLCILSFTLRVWLLVQCSDCLERLVSCCVSSWTLNAAHSFHCSSFVIVQDCIEDNFGCMMYFLASKVTIWLKTQAAEWIYMGSCDNPVIWSTLQATRLKATQMKLLPILLLSVF